jgi:hypothetical protein
LFTTSSPTAGAFRILNIVDDVTKECLAAARFATMRFARPPDDPKLFIPIDFPLSAYTIPRCAGLPSGRRQ